MVRKKEGINTRMITGKPFLCWRRRGFLRCFLLSYLYINNLLGQDEGWTSEVYIDLKRSISISYAEDNSLKQDRECSGSCFLGIDNKAVSSCPVFGALLMIE